MNQFSMDVISAGLRTFVAAILIILGLLFLWEIRGTLMLIFAAIILVILFMMPIRLLMSRFDMNRGLAIILSVVGFFVVIVLITLSIMPTIITQFAVLATDVVPKGVEQAIETVNSGALQEQFPFLETVIRDFEISPELINQILSQLSTAVSRLGGTVLPVVGGVASSVLSVLIIFFLSMYLLAEPELYVNGIIKVTPPWYRDRMKTIMRRIDTTLRAWLSVTGVSMIVVGLGTGLGLAALGIREWVALGVLAGVLSFIPNFGPIIAVVPSIAVAIVQAPGNVIWTVIIIYGISFIQSQVISPVLASERMNMPAILILLGQIIFGYFFGFLGIMLAVPLTAVVMVLVDEIYIKDILGDRPKEKIEELDDDLLPDTA